MAEQDISGLDELRRAMKSLKADPVILPSGVEIEDTRPIEPGDVVQLKSGGPKMTVTYVGSSVSVVWSYGDEVRTAKLPLVAVERYKKPESLFGCAIGRNSQISFGQPTLNLVKWNVDDETESDEEE